MKRITQILTGMKLVISKFAKWGIPQFHTLRYNYGFFSLIKINIHLLQQKYFILIFFA